LIRSIPLAHEVAEQLQNGSVLITATNRLAREYREGFNQHLLDQGRLAWESARILPFESWIYTLWQNIRSTQPQSATPTSITGQFTFDYIVLTPLQSQLMWEQIIADDVKRYTDNTQPLWNIPATAKTAMAAWQISREWKISLRNCEKSFLPDHRGFIRWARQFQMRCYSNNWIDKFELVNSVTEYVDQGNNLDIPPLIWTGFDRFTTQQQQLIDSLQETGVVLSIHCEEVADRTSGISSREYDSEYSQWLAAARWVKEKLDFDPNQRIAIVTPELDKSRSIIDYCLSQALCPAHIANPGSAREKPFHLSLGEKLAYSPVVDAALLLLSLAVHKELRYSAISETILCPFIAAADSESHERSRLEYWCRRKLPYRLPLTGFLETLQHSKSLPATPVLLEKLKAGCELLDSFDGSRSFSYWSELILSWLGMFGWPGERGLSSRELQTADAFKQEVSALRSLDLVAAPQTAENMFSILSQHLKEKSFEPESPDVNIEVLGVLESAGIKFDAIWFGGLIDNDWPPQLQDNPFIPHRLQVAAGFPRASISLNTALAEAQQLRLAKQCEELVLSRQRFNADVELLPSVLFGHDSEQFQSEPGLIHYFHIRKPSMESFTSSTGLALADGTIRGGTLVIQDQAACPFRAYARHRLGARSESPREPGLDARDRGSLVHGILQGIWASLESSASLESKSETALKKIVTDNIAHYSRSYFNRSGSSREFFLAQSESLEKLLMEWLEVEKTREQAFTVTGLEKGINLTLGKLNLSFKIDRIDQLADHTFVLIDYKTGDVGSVKEWVGERPGSPQLPLYALAHHNSKNQELQGALSVIVFGQVRFGKSAFIGVCSDRPFQLQKHPSNKVTALTDAPLDDKLRNWPALMAHFNDELTSLADAFYYGQAEVNPVDSTACKYCDLHGFCRIYEAGRIDG
jgi:probable DNA repair protein